MWVLLPLSLYSCTRLALLKKKRKKKKKIKNKNKQNKTLKKRKGRNYIKVLFKELLNFIFMFCRVYLKEKSVERLRKKGDRKPNKSLLCSSLHLLYLPWHIIYCYSVYLKTDTDCSDVEGFRKLTFMLLKLHFIYLT